MVPLELEKGGQKKKIRGSTFPIEGTPWAEAWKLRGGQDLGRGAVGLANSGYVGEDEGKARLEQRGRLACRVLHATQRTLDLTLWVASCSQSLLSREQASELVLCFRWLTLEESLAAGQPYSQLLQTPRVRMRPELEQLERREDLRNSLGEEWAGLVSARAEGVEESKRASS